MAKNEVLETFLKLLRNNQTKTAFIELSPPEMAEILAAFDRLEKLENLLTTTFIEPLRK
jgi:hypothetical protein